MANGVLPNGSSGTGRVKRGLFMLLLRWIPSVVLHYNTDVRAVNCLSYPTDGTPQRRVV